MCQGREDAGPWFDSCLFLGPNAFVQLTRSVLRCKANVVTWDQGERLRKAGIQGRFKHLLLG